MHHNAVAAALAQKTDAAAWRLGLLQQAHQRDVTLQAGEPGLDWQAMKIHLNQHLAQARQPLVLSRFSPWSKVS